MTAKKIYKSLGEGESVNHSTVISQTVDALDQAGEDYHYVSDSEGFLQIANGYLQLSKHLADLKEAGFDVTGTAHEGKRSVTAAFPVGFSIAQED